jgi:uncharacterized membrane protein HdeD (DUF308 family)
MTVPPGDRRASQTGWWHSVSEFLALIGPVGILTGILYYFGYISAKAYYAYFGISLSALDFSSTFYLVRNADTFFRPAATLLIVAAVLFTAHHVLRLVLARVGRRRARWVTLIACGISAILAGVGLFGLYGEPLGLAAPLCLAASALLLEYVLSTVARDAGFPRGIVTLIDSGVNLRRGIITALVVIAAFWAVTNLAQARGIENARLTELSLRLQPQAVVYSGKDLHLPPGVRVAVLNGPEGPTVYRYNGLRPLIYANDRWFLLPVDWRHDNGATVVVLQDGLEDVRIDLAP